MDVNERDRLAGAIAALRPDLAPGAGVDRLKSLKTWLTRNAMEWAYRDAVVRMCLCVIDPTTVTPARALTDGLWLTALRHLDGNRTDQPPSWTDAGPECATCGVRKANHRGVLPTIDHEPHEFTPGSTHTPADPAFISSVRPEFHRHEEQAS